MSTLYIVATPIGNLGDITLRALEVLKSVDLVAAEDTRTARKLLSANGISKRLFSCNAHAEEQAANRIIEELSSGIDVAYTSDAGTPGLSDPGRLLVSLVREAGFPIVPVPGVSAFTTLLCIAAPRGKGVLFEGFLSPKSGRRRRRLAELCEMDVPFVLFESPFRVLKLLADIADISNTRRVFIGREMTKMHEEYLSGTASELLKVLGERPQQKGEFSILVEAEKNN